MSDSLISFTWLSVIYLHDVFTLAWEIMTAFKWQVVSRGGRAEVLTNPHRPYGNNRVSLEEVKRIRAAGGWVCVFSLYFSLIPTAPRIEHMYRRFL